MNDVKNVLKYYMVSYYCSLFYMTVVNLFKNYSMKCYSLLQNHFLINLTYTIAPTITSSTKIIIPIINLFVATLKRKF
jgi:hypothetical protein